MTLVVVAVLALIAGVSFGVTAFGLALAVMVNEVSKRQIALVAEDLRIERRMHLAAQMERDGLKKSLDIQSAAIESSALPWYPKTEKMEKRYEDEAIDKMENPSFYADVVDGLGGTR